MTVKKKKNFLAALCRMLDLRSLTGDQTHTPCTGKFGV